MVFSLAFHSFIRIFAEYIHIYIEAHGKDDKDNENQDYGRGTG
jgi:hypothetical protein